MKLLGIETSGQACSVGLLVDNEVKVVHELAPMQQAQKILPMIDQLIKDSKLTLKQFDAIAFGCGPGSFTGVRIATSAAQGLGFALNLPLIPISSLAVLAQTAYEMHGWGRILAAVDARMQQIYWGVYQTNDSDTVKNCQDDSLANPGELIFPNEPKWYGVGDAWEVYKAQLPFLPLAIDSALTPNAGALLTLAKVKYAQKSWIRPEEALPIYLRNEVAKKN